MEICQFKVYIQKDSLVMAFIDKMDELLRRLTVNPLSSPSVVRVPSFSFFLMIRRPPRSTQSRSSAASDVYKRQA